MGSRRFFARRKGNLDANHLAIRDGLRKLGHFVVDLAGVGDGVPDLWVLPHVDWRIVTTIDQHIELLERGTVPVWLELKVGKGKLRASQVAWRLKAEARGIRVATVTTLDEALAAVRT